MVDDVEVFVVCDAESIQPQRAKTFDLIGLDEEGKPRAFPIVICRLTKKRYYAYLNACPHQGVPLNFEAGQQPLDPGRRFLMCGKHGAKFQIETGHCVEGPCAGERLEPISCVVIEGEVCIAGVNLAEDFEDEDDGFSEVLIEQ